MNTLRTLPLWALIAAAALLVASLSAVATLSVSTVSTSVQLSADTLSADAGTSITNATLTQTGSTISSSGTASGSSVEATTSLPVVSPGISASRWVYQVEVKEASASSWSGSSCYKIDLFADGSLSGSGFLKNATADNSSVEGVTFKVDAGAISDSSIASSWTSKVTATTGCS